MIISCLNRGVSLTDNWFIYQLAWPNLLSFPQLCNLVCRCWPQWSLMSHFRVLSEVSWNVSCLLLLLEDPFSMAHFAVLHFFWYWEWTSLGRFQRIDKICSIESLHSFASTRNRHAAWLTHRKFWVFSDFIVVPNWRSLLGHFQIIDKNDQQTNVETKRIDNQCTATK